MAAPAPAAGGEPQKQILSIIRDFSAEKSNGERRASGLKRRLEDLLAAADAATAELEASKRAREVAAEELSASQAQAAIAAKFIQALEATVSHLQEEISTVGSELEALKSKEDSERDEFLSQMYEMNERIRQFQRMVAQQSAENCSVQPPADGHHVSDQNGMIDPEAILKDLSEKVRNTDAEVHALDGEYQKDLLDLEKLHQELADTQARRALMGAVIEETKQVQEFGGRVAELEKVHNSLAEELQKRYVCPGCGVNNMGGLEGQEAAVAAAN